MKRITLVPYGQRKLIKNTNFFVRWVLAALARRVSKQLVLWFYGLWAQLTLGVRS